MFVLNDTDVSYDDGATDLQAWKKGGTQGKWETQGLSFSGGSVSPDNKSQILGYGYDFGLWDFSPCINCSLLKNATSNFSFPLHPVVDLPRGTRTPTENSVTLTDTWHQRNEQQKNDFTIDNCFLISWTGGGLMNSFFRVRNPIGQSCYHNQYS